MSSSPDRTLAKVLLQDAIATGSIELADKAFARSAPLDPGIQADMLEDILLAGSYEKQSLRIRGDSVALRPHMAKDEASYEAGLSYIATRLSQNSNLNLKEFDLVKHIALTDGESPHRTGAAAAIIQETIRQNTAWRPDIPGVFAEIGVDTGETEEDIRSYRQNKATRINAIGHAVTSWLQETPSVAMRMSAVDQAWWRDHHWQTDADKMPWASSAKIAADNDFILSVCRAMGPLHTDENPEKLLRAREITDGMLSRLHRGTKGNTGPQ